MSTVAKVIAAVEKLPQSEKNELLGLTCQSIAGFVRIGTNPKLIRRPMTVAEAFDYLDAWPPRST